METNMCSRAGLYHELLRRNCNSYRTVARSLFLITKYTVHRIMKN